LNKDQELIWEYQFKDTVYTQDFPHSITYRNNIIDTFTYNSEKALLMLARNIPLYPNIIFKLNLKTGERIDSTKVLMHAGGINAALLGDFDENGTEELVAIAIHNGYERAVLFSIDVDKIYGQSPAPPKYTFKDLPVADFNAYILLPITDYGKFFFRYNSPVLSSLNYYKESKEFQFYTVEGIGNNIITVHYRFSNDLKFIRLDCGDDAQYKRDSLVANKILHGPYTNTDEYYNLLKEQIRYWNGFEFVKEQELNK